MLCIQFLKNIKKLKKRIINKVNKKENQIKILLLKYKLLTYFYMMLPINSNIFPISIRVSGNPKISTKIISPIASTIPNAPPNKEPKIANIPSKKSLILQKTLFLL